jgi:putative MATE family efflux protein
MDRKLYQKIMKLAVPVIISNLLATFQIIADTVMLGRYQPADISLSALGVGSILLFMFFPVIMGLIMGSVAIIARRWGEKKYDEAKKVATDSLITLILISIPISLFGFFFGPHIIYYLGARGDVITEGSKYIMAVFTFIPFSVFVFTYHGILRAAGDTKTPMYIDFIMNSYNIFMNYALIFGNFGFPELGVLGAGIATGTSFLIGTLAYLILQYRNKLIIYPTFKRDLKYRIRTVRKLFDIGIPAGVDMGMWAISAVFVTPFVLHFGTVGYSAFQIGLRAESIAYMPAVGFSVATTTLTGQYLGAKKKEKARAVILISTQIVLIFMAIVGAILVLIPEYISMVFTTDQDVVVIAAFYLFIMGFSEPALGAIFTFAGGMRGAGYTKVPMYINFVGMIVIRLALIYLLAFPLGLGLNGIFIAITIEIFIRAFLFYIVFLKGDWKNVEV